MRLRYAAMAIIALSACRAGSTPAQVPTPPTPMSDTASRDQLPLGRGQLSQDNITIRLREVTLDIRFLPLDERVLRLLSDDSYAALNALLNVHRRRVDSIAASRGVRRPGIALVSFHALTPSTRFDPTVLSVSLRNRQYRPIGVLPLTPSFSSQQLDAGGSASGLFIYEEELPVTEPFTIGYLDASSEEWERRLPRLETERGRILGGRGSRDSTVRP